jgi:hypothetical protein
MAAFSTFLRFLKWKMDGKWKVENGNRIHHPCVLLGRRGEVAKRPFRVASVQVGLSSIIWGPVFNLPGSRSDLPPVTVSSNEAQHFRI